MKKKSISREKMMVCTMINLALCSLKSSSPARPRKRSRTGRNYLHRSAIPLWKKDVSLWSYTEQSYVGSLEVLISVAMDPLEQVMNDKRKRIITEQEVKAIFSIVRDICKIHYNFLQDLEKKRRSWVEKSSTVGDLFLNNVRIWIKQTDALQIFSRSFHPVRSI